MEEETLKARLRSFLYLYSISNDRDFPKRMTMIGFGGVEIKNRLELVYRIKELCDLLRLDLEEIKDWRL